jgi:hypothetical protein
MPRNSGWPRKIRRRKHKRELQRRTRSRGLKCRDAHRLTPARSIREASRLAHGGVTASGVKTLRGHSVLQGAPVRAVGAKAKAVLSM